MPTLDHLAFGVRDVDAIREDLGRLGFTTAPSVCRWTRRGRSVQARAASVVFESTYLDLVEVRDPAWDEQLGASSVYQKGIAPSGVVLASRALEHSRTRLSAGGIAIGEPYEIVREIRGGEPREIRYRIFSLRDASLPFAFIEDSAPEAMRTESWLRHANSATGLRCVHFRVPSLHAVRSRLHSVLGGASAGEPIEVDLGEVALVVHETPREGYLEAVSRLLPRRDRAGLLAIELAVAQPGTMRALLARNRIPSLDLDTGVAIEPAAGYGCGIVFVPAKE